MPTWPARTLYFALSAVTLACLCLGLGPLYARKTLILAHNLDTNHPVHRGMLDFAELVKEGSQGRIDIRLYANGQLGSEREVLEQLQIGAVALTKVSSISLESFEPLYSAINAPFIFSDESHAYQVLDGQVGEDLLRSTVDKRFRGLTFYAGGARSFYANKPVLKPEDLKGMKMRVLGSRTAMRMTGLLGGSAVPMPFGEVYTGLQQGVIDGAESSVTALTMSRHGEVAKHLSLDEHMIAPDVLLISTTVWDSLSSEDQAILKSAAERSKRNQRKYWQEAVTEHLKKATEEMGVTVHHPNKKPFADLVKPLHKELKAKSPELHDLLELIESNGSRV